MAKSGKIRRVREKKSKVKLVREISREESARESDKFDSVEEFVESATVVRPVPSVLRKGLDVNVETDEGNVEQKRAVREGEDFRPRQYSSNEAEQENRRYYGGAQQTQRRIVLNRAGETAGAAILRDRVIRRATGGGAIVQQNPNQFVERGVFNDEGAVSRYYEEKKEEGLRVKRRDNMF